MSSAPMGTLRPSRAVPAFPGAISSSVTSVLALSRHAMACSLDPPPTTRNLTVDYPPTRPSSGTPRTNTQPPARDAGREGPRAEAAKAAPSRRTHHRWKERRTAILRRGPGRGPSGHWAIHRRRHLPTRSRMESRPPHMRRLRTSQRSSPPSNPEAPRRAPAAPRRRW